MELFVLGLVLGVGAAKRKAVTKAVAKGYMAVTEKTKTVTSAIREDMHDAIEEARSERDQSDETPEIAVGEYEEEVVELHEETASVPAVIEPVAAAKPRGSLMKSLMKSYVAVTDKTRGAVAGLREEVRDAIEEARYEREQAAQHAEPEVPAETEAVEAVAEAAPVATPKTPTVKRPAAPKAAATDAVTAHTAKTAKTTKAAASAAGKSAAPAPRRPKAAPKQSENADKMVDRVLEVAEIAAEVAL